MITLTCSSCRATIEMDDAFAGGVCRCSHCGAIQTVSKNASAGKTLYANKKAAVGATAPPGTGLDQLAEIVASSGLGSSRLRKAPPPEKKSRSMAILIGASVAGLVVIAGVIAVLMRPKAPGSQPPVAIEGGGDAPSAAVEPSAAPTPAFAGLPMDRLVGKSVVFVIDRGTASADAYAGMVSAVTRSANGLGAATRWAVILWDTTGAPPVRYPAGGYAYGTQPEAESARKQLLEITPFGPSNAEGALRRAVAMAPDAIVVATGKGSDLDDAFVTAALDAVKSSRVIPIHTVAVSSIGPSAALSALSAKTGGVSVQVTPGALR